MVWKLQCQSIRANWKIGFNWIYSTQTRKITQTQLTKTSCLNVFCNDNLVQLFRMFVTPLAGSFVMTNSTFIEFIQYITRTCYRLVIQKLVIESKVKCVWQYLINCNSPPALAYSYSARFYSSLPFFACLIAVRAADNLSRPYYYFQFRDA